jgi:hypothetical protein
MIKIIRAHREAVSEEEKMRGSVLKSAPETFPESAAARFRSLLEARGPLWGRVGWGLKPAVEVV